jgi:hypothetical protein
MTDECAGRKSAPQSYQQQRLWFMSQLEAATAEYNIPQVWRIRGPLDLEALRRAINGVVARHESLRTRFDEANGKPVQIVDPCLELDLPLCDLSTLGEQEQQRSVDEELRRAWDEPFDLRRGPLIRAKVLRLGRDDHVAVRTTHHIVTDGWSEEVVFNRELASLYAAFVEGREATLPALNLQYADYALWQRQAVEAETLNPGLRYWRSQLAGLSDPLPVPSRRPRRSQWESGAMQRVVIGDAVVDDMRRLARQESVTLATVWLAAFQVLLARWTGEHDIPVGVVVANRQRSQLKGLIGFFLNFVVVRGDLRGEPTFRAFLRQIADRCYDAYSHQDVPLEKLVEELNPPRSLAWTPLFQVVFNMLNYPRVEPQLSDLHVAQVPIFRDARATFDLKFDVRADDEGTVSSFYNSYLFEPDDIAALLNDFRLLLHELLGDPDVTVGPRAGRTVVNRPGVAASPRGAESSISIGANDGSDVLSEDQRALCELFAEVLGIEQVAPDDDFFALGGHSLLVMMLRNRIHARLKVDLPVRTVFEAPTVRELSARLRP